MNNEIYKINLTDLSKIAHLGYFVENQSALNQMRFCLKSEVEESQWKQNIQNIKFAVRFARSVLIVESSIVQTSMKYFLNLFIEKHYNYQDEYNWQDLKPLLLLVNYLKQASNFKSFSKQILNPHLHRFLLNYFNE